MNTISEAAGYARRIRELALQASAGQEMTQELQTTLTHARFVLGRAEAVSMLACQQQLQSFMRDDTDGEAAIMYNAVLNWAIRGLKREH